MENNKKLIQDVFDEVSARTGMPRIELADDDSAALPFGDGLLLYIHYRGEMPEVDFTVPIGSVPAKKKAYVYERLLSANFYWVGTHGATLSYQLDLDEIIIQYREDAVHLNTERLQSVLEGFLSVAMKWKEMLAKFIEEADEEDAEHDHAAGHGHDDVVLFEA